MLRASLFLKIPHFQTALCALTSLLLCLLISFLLETFRILLIDLLGMGNKKNQRKHSGKHKAMRKVFKGSQFVDSYMSHREQKQRVQEVNKQDLGLGPQKFLFSMKMRPQQKDQGIVWKINKWMEVILISL